MRKILIAVLMFAGTSAVAQIKNPVKWEFRHERLNDEEVALTFTAHLEDGWHIYSQFMEEGGPLPTTFTFVPSEGYELVGNTLEESPVIKKYSDIFLIEMAWFNDEAVFTQKIRLKAPAVTVNGFVEFMACTDTECLLPEKREFTFEITGGPTPEKKTGLEMTPKPVQKEGLGVEKKALPAESGKKLTGQTGAPKEPAGKTVAAVTEQQQAKETEGARTKEAAAVKKTTLPAARVNAKVADAEVVEPSPDTGPGLQPVQITLPETEEAGSRSLWGIFIAGLLGGLAAIFMPCIFPMLPLTVGYFAKKDGTRKSSVGSGLLYGLSIIVIYVSLGLGVSLIFGSDSLNALSTNGIFNIFFFLILVLFAASFLGAFELTLPAQWVNRVDKKADSSQGWLGIFFMAATLALVSFSCTGPIVGTLLVETATMGTLIGPTLGMFGFSLALALPFSVFSMFPSWMKSLPRSGSWLNTVKVVLGFLELALALKFLSNVDLAYHWEWLDREVFLALWIVIFGLLGLYLLGKIRLTADTAPEDISPLRLGLAIVVLAFTLYMVPGMWGAPLKAISAFLPPQQTQDFDLHTAQLTSGMVGGSGYDEVQNSRKKYAGLFHAPHNLDAFFDYDEGLAYAHEVNKPVLVDFTGHACVNCRKMETAVWSDGEILDILKNKYVLVQLYVDDKTQLPESEYYASAFNGKMITTIGGKNSDLQASAFNTNSQPYYVLLDPQGNLLAQPTGAEYDVAKYKQFLLSGLNQFYNLQKNIK